ncbi:stearoyl-CoA desaturase [Methylomarinovum caldicuralii]|uniref:Stearoyl-CoA desaturase n=1 Tax=Methylomarinovum caldicuralii TaxID=438856 RepID=A0AAU9CSA5_9GAMM|nr:fatty acid desaturase [Methylomarinovum caldicuralii]BCX80797.1 stearoyl-CoA desaturase [Methylomarinovum caldicuralii]
MFGLFELPWWGYLLVILALTHVTIVSVTLYLHRCQAHRAMDLHPLVSHFFRFWLWLTTGMRTKDWAAIHRKHHARCETEEDPHSPQVLGIRKVLLEGAELYSQARADREAIEQYGWGTPEDWVERHIYSHPRLGDLGIALMLVIDLVCFGVLGLTVWAVQMLWIPVWAAGVINGLGHYVGYRNFETDDAATNLIPWGILIGGEELHNNHHAYPSSAKLSLRWWEFDLGWLYIRLLSLFGLAKVKRVAPKVRIEAAAGEPSAETIKALMRNRCHVLTLYARKVILPVLRLEARRADRRLRRLFRQVRPLLVREDLTLDGERERLLQQAIEASDTLETVYDFKNRLKTIWARNLPHPEVRLQQLRIWCQEAEQSGIDTLREFAALLRGYRLQTVA